MFNIFNIILNLQHIYECVTKKHSKYSFNFRTSYNVIYRYHIWLISVSSDQKGVKFILCRLMCGFSISYSDNKLGTVN